MQYNTQVPLDVRGVVHRRRPGVSSYLNVMDQMVSTTLGTQDMATGMFAGWGILRVYTCN